MLNAAIKYSQMGLSIFPLVPFKKTPATDHGFKDATTDKERIFSWWNENPNYNIGIRTGNGFKVICLDIDNKKGKNGFLWLESQPSLPKTPSQNTPSGGRQYLFSAPDEYIPCSSGDGKKGIAPGIDIRGDGGYFVVAPSVLKKTDTYEYSGPYEWLTEQSTFDISLAPAPDFLLDAIRAISKPPEPEMDKRETTLAISISDVLFKYGISLKEMRPGVFQGVHPLHGSSNGMNFRVDASINSWACWRHTKPNGRPVGGGPLQLIAMMEGILQCEECGPRSLRGHRFNRVMDIAREKFGVPKYKLFINDCKFEVMAHGK